MGMQQLSSLTIVLKPSNPVDTSLRSWSMGPFLQGALMEHVDPGYAGFLHQLPFNPYSQHCRWQGDKLIWRVNALTEEAASGLIDPLMHVQHVEVRSANTSFEVERVLREMVSLKSITDTIAETGPRKLRILFLTPTSFKSQGVYQIVPSVRLMVQNLLMHYGQVYENDREGYAETVEFVERQAIISSYNLHSSYFGSNGSKGGLHVPGFVGTMTLTLRGSEMVTGLVRMLLRFGEFAGVGIKTSMGMGAIRLLPPDNPNPTGHNRRNGIQDDRERRPNDIG